MTTFLRYAFYPLLFIAMLAYAVFELHQPVGRMGGYYGYYLTVLVSLMLLVEFLFPLRKQWRMTWNSFLRRDLPFMLMGGATLTLANYFAGMLLLHLGMSRGEAHLTLPLFPAVVLALIIPDFLWYWVHRYSHESRSRLGNWFWRMHLAHHLPQQVYLLMHAVSHPVNVIIVRLILTLPLFALGFSTEALFVANLIVGLQGLVSHYNVDIRTGWWNYILVGAELHRFHHSADADQAKNYGAVVSLWDLLFGTFYYRPQAYPEALGIADSSSYPTDRQLWRVLKLPFVS
jgi:sterol desaturase/sphingolipid hydroxylase (fatty acid hydroxylase superfamily)